MSQAVDLFTTYQFVKRLVTPFEKWKAYSLGIIDSQGHQLRTRDQFKTQAERDAFGYLDLLALNLKKLLAKLPGGDKTIATYAAALLLLKEYPKVQKEDVELLDNLEPLFESYMQQINEDGAPVNAVGTGNIAGVGVGDKGEPGVKRTKYKRENEVDTKKLVGDVQAILVRRSKP